MNALHAILERLTGENLHLSGNGTRRFDELDPEFPFLPMAYGVQKWFASLPKSGTDHLALLMPLDGSVQIQSGERLVQLGAGEVLVAQESNVTMLATTEELDVQLFVIRFLPRFVYSLGSPSQDYFFLLPFYADYGLGAPVIRGGSSLCEMHRTIDNLVQCYFEHSSYFEIGCKALFLELLYRVACHFRDVDSVRTDLIIQKERAARLKPVLEFVECNYTQTITLRDAASLAKISVPRFVRLFKQVAGMSFVSYLTHVRLTRSVRLLKESSLTIAEVAYQVGFSDQSYFDRRFKAAFRQTPRDFRLMRETPSLTPPVSAARSFRRAQVIKESAMLAARAFAASGSQVSATRATREAGKTLISKEAAGARPRHDPRDAVIAVVTDLRR